MSAKNTMRAFIFRYRQRSAVGLALFILVLSSPFMPAAVSGVQAYTTLTPVEVETGIADGTIGTIIDVRPYDTYCTTGHIPCALNYPWIAYLQSHYTELDPDSMFVLVCENGIRSAQAAAFLDSQGFSSAYTMSSGMGDWQGETQTCDTQCPSLYFPHVTTRSSWGSEITLVNTADDQAVAGTLKAFGDDGHIVNIRTVFFPAHGRKQITVADDFEDHADIGYIIFTTAAAEMTGYSKFFQEGKIRTAIPAVDEVSTSDIYIAHIASNNTFWTGISLVNTASEERNPTIIFNNGQRIGLTIAAGEHRTFTIAGLFGGQPQPDLKSAQITNAGGIIGLELFGTGNQLDGLLLADDVADVAKWWTGIVAYNPSNAASEITITPYSAVGTVLTPLTLDITGKEKYIGVVKNLDLPDDTAWFRIDSTRPLAGFELFGTRDGKQLAAYAEGSGSGAREGVFPKIGRDGWTGIAFVNTEDAAASVTLTAYNNSGTALAVTEITVGGYAKVVNLAENLFTQQDVGSATYVSYTSSRDVVGLQLNGSADGSMLDGLPALD